MSAVAFSGLCLACADGIGVTCGGSEYAAARALLPDTGQAAGAEIQLVITEADPYLGSGQTDVSIFRSITGFNAAEPNPRVRLVRADGEVLLDEIATRIAPDQPWRVLFRTYSATVSTGLFAALREGSLLLEIRAVDSDGPGTRVALAIEEAGVTPIGRCA